MVTFHPILVLAQHASDFVSLASTTKCVYIDRHERDNVVKYRDLYLKSIPHATQ